jgi:hypothetical protein
MKIKQNTEMPQPLDKGPFYHGTRADLRIGELLTAGFQSNYRPEVKMNHIYFTALVDGAGMAAELAPGTNPPRVYEVKPMVEKTRITDPDSEDFGKSRIDSPEAANIAMDAAERQDSGQYLRRPMTDAVSNAVFDEHDYHGLASAERTYAIDAADVDSQDAAQSSEELDRQAWVKNHKTPE